MAADEIFLQSRCGVMVIWKGKYAECYGFDSSFLSAQFRYLLYLHWKVLIGFFQHNAGSLVLMRVHRLRYLVHIMRCLVSVVNLLSADSDGIVQWLIQLDLLESAPICPYVI